MAPVCKGVSISFDNVDDTLLMEVGGVGDRSCEWSELLGLEVTMLLVIDERSEVKCSVSRATTVKSWRVMANSFRIRPFGVSRVGRNEARDLTRRCALSRSSSTRSRPKDMVMIGEWLEELKGKGMDVSG